MEWRRGELIYGTTLVQRKSRLSTSTIQWCYFTLQNETLSEPLNNNTKRDKISRKQTVRPKSVSAQQNEKLTLYDSLLYL